MAGLILLRHGESTANADGLFTGALDLDLTEWGRTQSLLAGQLIRDAGPAVDVVICSPLTRARHTARIVMSELHGPSELIIDWRLTERSYGALTGRPKTEVLQEFGPATYVDWRRSVDHAPPPLTDDQLRVLRSQPALEGCPDDAVASTESLEDVIVRVRPLIREALVPRLRAALTVLVVGHGNSLRALVADVDGLDDEQLRRLNIPSGQPILYRIHDDGTPLAGSGEYLDPTSARAAAILLEQQGGT
jgi:2,3-bisphosphoglycerate-dependent phosphoglycerate mutase